jgi:hypothetical protein
VKIMGGQIDQTLRDTAKRFATGAQVCPSCLLPLAESVNWCPGCQFSGADTLEMFPIPLAPLQTVLDAANLWMADDLVKIERRMETLRQRFPQIRWSLYSLDAEDVPNLRLFGFWLLNASPLNEGETEEQRAWTIVIVFNEANGKVVLVPGYGVEPWVPDEQWRQALSTMAEPWNQGRRRLALERFFEAAEKSLRQAYSRVNRQLRRGL